MAPEPCRQHKEKAPGDAWRSARPGATRPVCVRGTELAKLCTREIGDQLTGIILTTLRVWSLRRLRLSLGYGLTCLHHERLQTHHRLQAAPAALAMFAAIRRPSSPLAISSCRYQCVPANAMKTSNERANANARPSPTAKESGNPSRMALSSETRGDDARITPVM